MEYKSRKTLPHEIPSWVPDGSEYFIAICCQTCGQNQLCLPDISAKLKNAVFYYQQQQVWWIHLLLFMPDHLHAVISFNRDPGMKKAVAQWKRYTAGSFPVKWQRGFFDHRLRKTESFLEKADYIRNNPVRAGFVKTPADWPYCWTCSER